ncbi:MAG: Lrp/AsnC family transcriptional regulator [Acidihalobacter sp.]|uniref:Lrp/AsnC family transcriptional regulator n=1 Tax=Acidihalobacter sp. TaxID=1872108 RepID=UPI00307DAE36
MTRKLDQFDENILKILTSNAREPIARIARSVNLSRTAVDARIRRLESTGVIAGYRLLLGGEESVNTKCILNISLNECRCEEATPYILQFPEVKKCYSVAGDLDLIVYVEAEDTQRILEIVEKLSQVHKIQQIRTHIILSDWLGQP